jgi:hypothetical protein
MTNTAVTLQPGDTATITAAAAPPPPAVIPSAPAGLAAVVGDGTVTLSWSAVATATSYHIYRNGVNVSTGAALTFADTGLVDGTLYHYEVTAQNAVGEGGPAFINATPVAPPPPPPSGAGVILPVPAPHFVPAFGSYPVGTATDIWNATTLIEITGKTFRGSANTSMPWAWLRFTNCTGGIWIHDCDFDTLDWDCIDIMGCSGQVRIEYNRVNPFARNAHIGQSGVRAGADFVQFDNSRLAAGSYIRNNKLRVGIHVEDIVSTVNNSGGQAGQLLEIDHNAIQGALNGEGTDSTSGTGTMCADNTNSSAGHIWVHHNTYLDPGQVGVGISMGVDCHVTDNVIYGHKRAGSNVGIYTPYVGGTPNPGGHEVRNNRIWYMNAAGNPNPLWDGGASGVIAGLSPQTNVLQDTTIDPATLVVTL